MIDTNILSTFARIDRLDLLLKLFKEKEISISSNVFIEIRRAEERGYKFCNSVNELINNKKINILSPTNNEYKIAKTLPVSFGLGERDSLAITVGRGAIFTTNEKKVVNYCKKNDIEVVTLNHILRAFWEMKILTKEEVNKLIDEIEEKDNLVITSRKEIISD